MNLDQILMRKTIFRSVETWLVKNIAFFTKVDISEPKMSPNKLVCRRKKKRQISLALFHQDACETNWSISESSSKQKCLQRCICFEHVGILRELTWKYVLFFPHFWQCLEGRQKGSQWWCVLALGRDFRQSGTLAWWSDAPIPYDYTMKWWSRGLVDGGLVVVWF